MQHPAPVQIPPEPTSDTAVYAALDRMERREAGQKDRRCVDASAIRAIYLTIRPELAYADQNLSD